MKQFRSARGTLATKARDALFTYFGDVNLPRINTSAPPIEISNWKKSNEVRKCYNKLFENNNKVLARLLEKIFGKNLPKPVHSAGIHINCTVRSAKLYCTSDDFLICVTIKFIQ